MHGDSWLYSVHVLPTVQVIEEYLVNNHAPTHTLYSVHVLMTVQVIEEYLVNTHAPTHTLYKMKLLHVFEVNRDVEMQNFVDRGNR